MYRSIKCLRNVAMRNYFAAKDNLPIKEERSCFMYIFFLCTFSFSFVSSCIVYPEEGELTQPLNQSQFLGRISLL